MYFSKTLHYAAFTSISYAVSFIIGILLGLFLPQSWFGTTMEAFTNIAFHLMLYFSVPYLFFSLLVASYDLNKTHKFMQVFSLVVKTGGIITVVITFISIVFFYFLPNSNIISLVSNQYPTILLSPTEIAKNLFSPAFLQTDYATQVLIIPFFIVALLIGITANSIVSNRHSLIESCNAIRAINLKIIERIFPWLVIPVIIMTARNISSARFFAAIAQFNILLFFLAGLGIVLTFIVYPFLLRRQGAPIFYKTWCKKIIPAIILGFSSGNMAGAYIALLYMDSPNDSKHKITDTSISLSFIFGRAGTAVAIVLSYIIINKIYSALSLSVVQLLLVFLLSVFFAMLSNATTGSIIISSIASIFSISNILTEELYLSIIPLAIIIHALATVIDIATCGYINLHVAHKVHQSTMHDMAFASPAHSPKRRI